MNNKLLLPFFGWLFVIIGIGALFSAYLYSDFSIIFWFCYLSIPLAGIGILMKNSNLIKSQLYILAIPDLIWSIDFITYLILGHSFFGTSDYVFQSGHLLPKIITLQHLIAIPIIFYSLIILKTRKESSWKISIIQITIIFILTRLFTTANDNINCAFNICGKYQIDIGNYYIILWFILAILMIYLSRHIFIKLYLFVKTKQTKYL